MTGQSIAHIVDRMTLAEKIGQMTQVSNSSISPSEVADHSIGSVLSGGNDNPTPNEPAVWADMVGAFVDAAAESRLGIPLLYGVDAVHGHSSVRGATVFPHNIGLGAAGDEELVRRIGRATSTEMLATGIRWTFAPTVAVAQDPRWGRTYESYGRNPELVSRLGAALVDGLHGPPEPELSVLACLKHYVGDGGTTWGTVRRDDWLDHWAGWGANWQIDQGDTRLEEDELRRVHLAPYESAIAAGALSVMASYSSWNGGKLHAHRRLLTDVLKGELGFAGFVVSDWMGVDQIDRDYDRAVEAAINAGIDMCMVPFDFKRFIDTVTRAVEKGAIRMSRIDDAVLRIVRTKSALGLLETAGASPPPLAVVGAPEHRHLAAEAARRSAVLLKTDGTLPLGTGAPVDLAGVAADDIGLQCGGWTVGWQGGTGQITSGVTLLDALRTLLPNGVAYDPEGRFDGQRPSPTGIVCVAEQPYAEGEGDCALPTASDQDRATFARMRERCERLVLVIYSGRPLVVPDLIAQSDAVVAVWLPGTEMSQIAELLLGGFPFEGRLSQPWPRHASDLGDSNAVPLFPVGHGLSTSNATDLTSRAGSGLTP